MQPKTLALARQAARQMQRNRAERAWRDSPIADLSRVQPVNRPRRILRPVY